MNYKKSYTVDQATAVLEKYCAYQERCHSDVEKKLLELQLIPEARDHIILHLLQHNYLNEERFAKAFVRGKFNQKKWGRQKITHALKFKRISAYLIQKGLEEIDEEAYYNTLQEEATKKLALLKDKKMFQRKHKLIKFLQSKGFETALIYEIVNAITEN